MRLQGVGIDTSSRQIIATMISLSKPLPVSWWHVVVSLERHGFTHTTIARAIGSTRGTVESWKNKNAAPRHEYGERLIDLWREVTGKGREDLPRRPGIVSTAEISRPVRRARSAV